MLGYVRKHIIAQSYNKENKTNREKYPKRGEKCCYSGNYEEETDTILEKFYLAFALPCHGLNRNIFYTQSASEICHGDGGRIGKGIRQQVDILADPFIFYQPEA